MITLPDVVSAYGRPDFKETLKQVIEKLDTCYLPLQQGLARSSYVSEKPFTVLILNCSDNNESILVKAGVFYTGIIAGCNCADDPSPVDEINEYCEIEIALDKQTTNATIRLLSD